MAPLRYEPVGCTFSGAAGWTQRTSFKAPRGSGKADLGSATRWGRRPSLGGTVTLWATSRAHAHAVRGPRTFSDICLSSVLDYDREGVKASSVTQPDKHRTKRSIALQRATRPLPTPHAAPEHTGECSVAHSSSGNVQPAKKPAKSRARVSSYRGLLGRSRKHRRQQSIIKMTRRGDADDLSA